VTLKHVLLPICFFYSFNSFSQKQPSIQLYRISHSGIAFKNINLEKKIIGISRKPVKIVQLHPDSKLGQLILQQVNAQWLPAYVLSDILHQHKRLLRRLIYNKLAVYKNGYFLLTTSYVDGDEVRYLYKQPKISKNLVVYSKPNRKATRAFLKNFFEKNHEEEKSIVLKQKVILRPKPNFGPVFKYMENSTPPFQNKILNQYMEAAAFGIRRSPTFIWENQYVFTQPEYLKNYFH